MQNLRVIEENQFFGYDDTSPPQLVARGVFQKADNCLVSYNKIAKVPGSSALATSIAAYPFNGIAAYEKVSTTVKYIVVSINGTSNAQLYSWSGSGEFSALGTANLTNSKDVYFETADDILFGFNGVEEVDWDGTTVTKNRAGVPLGLYPAWFHNYLFVANNSSYPSRLYWSNLGDPTTFTVTNYVDINPGDADKITGLGMLQDELFVFKQNTIWSVTGWSGSSFSSTTIATQNTNARIIGYGCIAPRSIVSTGNDIFFLSMFGNTPHIRSLRKTQYATTLGGGIISEHIKTTMDDITKSAVSKVVGVYDGRYIYWAIPTGGSSANNKIIVLDTVKSIPKSNIWVFTTMTGKNAEDLALSTIPGGVATVVFTDSSTTSGLVFKIDSSVSTDNGADITMDVITRGYMVDPARKNKWKYLYMRYKSGYNSSVTVNAAIDGVSTYSSEGTISLASLSPALGSFILGQSLLGGTTLQSARINLAHRIGKMIAFEFTETSNNPIELYDYQIYSFAKGLRAS
jgi:hypothetical protein